MRIRALSPAHRSPWRRYLAALAAIGVAIGLRVLLDPALGNQYPAVTLFGGIAFAAWYGGVGPGLLATVAGFVLAFALFFEPRGAIDVSQPVHFVALGAYLLSSTVIIGFAKAMELGRSQVEAGRDLLRVTVESIGDGVITTDAQGRVTALNPVAQTLTGCATEDSLGKPLESVFRIIDEQSREPVENPARRALDSGGIVGLATQKLLLAPDGTERAIDESAALIRSEDGRVYGSVLVFRDVSDRRRIERRLEESERDLSDFFEDASIGIHWVGLDGTILRANRAELEMLGYEPEEYIGRPIQDFHVDAEVIGDILRRLHEGEVLSDYETRLRRKDGSILPVAIDSSVKWEGDRFLHTRCFTRDISDRIRADEMASRMMALVASSDDAILSKDLDGIIQTCNRGAERLFGYSSDELVGSSVSLLIPPERAGEEDSIRQRIRSGGHVETYETIRRRKDGSEIAIELTVSPLFGSGGCVIGASKIARDIGPRKRTEADLVESRQLLELGLRDLQSIYDNVPVGLCQLDRDLRYVRVNDRMAEMNGFSAADHLGRSVREMVPHLADQVEPEFRRVLETGRPRVEVELTGETAARPGFIRSWLVSWFPQYDFAGNVTGINVAGQEITERKRAEIALLEADRRKNEFLATLAHELRNPLAPIRNGLSILADGGNDPRNAVEIRQIMERQLTHLVRLVDDLFDLSRISRGRLELKRERVDLKSVISVALEACRPLAASKGIDLTVTVPDAPIHFEADPVRLGQVLTNIVNNACKFSDPGSEVRVAGMLVGAEISISVEDSGIGIEPEQLAATFEMFNQINRAQGQQGLGIGLALAKRLIDLHDGRIDAASDGPGKGSRFVVTIPVSPAPAPTQSTSPASTHREVESMPVVDRPGNGKRILVVDDNQDSAVSLALWLKLKGYETQVAHDGLEALSSADSFRPAVLLLDIGLPKLDGYDVCRRIRSEPWGRSMQIFALTGWGQEDAKRATAAAGFDAHLVKPVEHALLEKILSAPPKSE